MFSYLATRHYPVGDSQKGQTHGDPQHRPALHSDGLLPQTREVLVPDSQQLLLAVGMGDKLKGDETQEKNKRERERRQRSRCYELMVLYFFLRSYIHEDASAAPLRINIQGKPSSRVDKLRLHVKHICCAVITI